MKAAEWIDRVKAAHGLQSDYAAAKALGFSRNTISNYRSGSRHTFDDAGCLKVAELLGIDPAVVLVDQAMERARLDGARGAWSAVLQRLGGVAAGILLMVGGGGNTNAHAGLAPVVQPSNLHIGEHQKAARRGRLTRCRVAAGPG